MSIITEDNISQIENMGFSKNASKLLFKENITPKDIIQIINSKTLEIEETKKKKEKQKELPTSDLHTIADENPDAFISPDSIPYAPYSPAYIPSELPSPHEGDSPQYVPYSPSNTPDSSPPNSQNYVPTTPDSSPPIMQGGGNIENQNWIVGGKAHYRGDIKPNREWTVDKLGDKFITIVTDDFDGLGTEESLKVVNPAELYTTEPEYTFINPNEQMDPNYQNYNQIPMQMGNAYDGANAYGSANIYEDPNSRSTKINFAPVIKIFNEGNDMSQTGEKEGPQNMMDPILNPFGIQTMPITNSLEIENKEMIPDFNKNIIIKKI
jgi:hypothetical protein